MGKKEGQRQEEWAKGMILGPLVHVHPLHTQF